MFDFLLNDITWKDYPLATASHWLQGALVGWLLVQAHYRRHWHLIGYACIATLCFLTYEGYEQWRISDRGDVDVLNYALLVHVSAIATVLYHEIRRKLKCISEPR